MRWTAVLALLLAAVAAAPAAGQVPALSAEERSFCESEATVVENRQKVFEAQGLSAKEIAARNRQELKFLDECRGRFRAQKRRALEEREDMAEVERRLGPNATERERERLWRQIRRERIASRDPGSLTPEERAELAAGMKDELLKTHQALDAAHARDPAFMRVVHSALACYHGDLKYELENAISSEESMLKLGSGDRQKLYSLKSELRASDEVLERSREAARKYPGGLDRCTSPTVAVLAHCLAIRFDDARREPACESEEIQQYIRLVK